MANRVPTSNRKPEPHGPLLDRLQKDSSGVNLKDPYMETPSVPPLEPGVDARSGAKDLQHAEGGTGRG